MTAPETVIAQKRTHCMLLAEALHLLSNACKGGRGERSADQRDWRARGGEIKRGDLRSLSGNQSFGVDLVALDAQAFRTEIVSMLKVGGGARHGQKPHFCPAKMGHPQRPCQPPGVRKYRISIAGLFVPTKRRAP